ncbi:conserved hypothetical protein [Xanthomonas citri pv. citri]|uniref:Uncharacterized protein n=1 Tax=Xanthomonas citri pv. citri TaxID=611301 RepID=A0A0U5F824_XANCI|nr:conserved hypothetical protein [Xanthomonas citri pv. citri]CEE17161.1 conserved hypothetical protein [Xanthomonas citri pv. citri]CEE18225.1 conserved hypothetical protein [Xanthomonas citri pv. citri]CEE23627.1 conserved hypothetical protein [Xanthomonas citri pv. citri]CEE23835.1 conserved hypothetical protein [Xanthomonas citri pv. citri]
MQCSVQVRFGARTMILHPDVGEGAKPAGSSLQAGFFMPGDCRVKRQPRARSAADEARAVGGGGCRAHRGERTCMAWSRAQNPASDHAAGCVRGARNHSYE